MSYPMYKFGQSISKAGELVIGAFFELLVNFDAFPELNKKWPSDLLLLQMCFHNGMS